MEKFGKFGIGDAIIVFLMASCVTFCLYLTFVKSEAVPQKVIPPVIYDEQRWDPASWQHFSECQAISDNYGVLLKMWNWPDKTIGIHIPKNHLFSTGTDGACQAFGIMAKRLLDIYDDRWLLTVTSDGFIPSARMPINLEWAKILAEGY